MALFDSRPLSQIVQTAEFPWSFLHTGCFMEGLTAQCKWLIRCFLVPLGSCGANAIHIWIAVRGSNKTEDFMPGMQSGALLSRFQETFFK